MKISARDKLKGWITKVVHGPAGAEISIHVAPDVEVGTVITESSAKELGLKRA
jgi:molybdopterin-binding protein